MSSCFEKLSFRPKTVQKTILAPPPPTPSWLRYAWANAPTEATGLRPASVIYIYIYVYIYIIREQKDEEQNLTLYILVYIYVVYIVTATTATKTTINRTTAASWSSAGKNAESSNIILRVICGALWSNEQQHAPQQ